jgi:hypothetical protein
MIGTRLTSQIIITSRLDESTKFTERGRYGLRLKQRIQEAMHDQDRLTSCSLDPIGPE